MRRLLERTFRVAAARERVWEHLANVEAWPSWARHIRRVDVEPPGALTSSTAGTIRLTNGIRSTFRMTLFDPQRSWKWSGPFLWLTVDYDHVFEAVDDATTEVRFVLDGSGFGVSVFGRLFAAIYARNLDRAIPRLVAEIESLPR